LYFGLPVTSLIIGVITVELLDPENMGVTVEIVFLSTTQAEIQYFRFSGRHLGLSTSGCIRYYRGYHRSVGGPENMGVAVEIVFLSSVLPEI
jgi:hypothetical protein